MGADLTITAGAAKDFLRQVRASDGSDFTSVTTPFDGTETLVCQVWPGDTLAAVATPTVTWSNSDTGVFKVAFVAGDTSALTPGTYRFRVKATRSAKTGEIDRGTLRILPAPSTGAVDLAFCTFDDMLKFAPWIEDLQAESDQVGFTEQRVRATNRLIDCLCTLWKPQGWGAGWTPLDGGYDFGTDGTRWLREQLIPLTVGGSIPSNMVQRTSTPANYIDSSLSTALLLYPEVKEIVARWAIGYVCDAQIGRQSDRDFVALARRFITEGNDLFKCRRFEIDTANPQTGTGFLIDGGNTSLR